MVNASDERAERDVIFDEPDTVVGVVRRRGIVDDEEHAGKRLHQEQE